jgi:cytochrome c-type biogenesis protein CcmH/NrfG
MERTMKRGTPVGRPGSSIVAALRAVGGVGLVYALLFSCLFPAFAAVPPSEVLMRAGRLADAWPVARSEAEARPSDLDAQERLIDLAHTMQLTSMILATYRGRVSRDDNDADGWYLLGRLAMSIGEAEGCYKKALAVRPDHPRATRRCRSRAGSAGG